MTKKFTEGFPEMSRRVADKSEEAANNLLRNSKKIWKNGNTNHKIV